MPASNGWQRARATVPGASSVPLLAVLWLASTQAVADAARDARMWLDRMSKAAQELNYDGTFVYRNGTHVESMRIIHRADASGERERLVSLSGVAREVIRDDARVTCILPDNDAVLVDRSRQRPVISPSSFEASERLMAHYELSVMGRDRIAGRDTHVLSIAPRDDYRYGYRLWLDADHALMLKSELRGPDGRTLEQLIYTSVSFPDSIPDALLEPGVSGETFTWYTTEDRAQATAARPEGQPEGWKVTWLPGGFELGDKGTDRMGKSQGAVSHLFYSDGLASVSVYIEEHDGGADWLEGLSSMGAMNAYGILLDGYQVTVVGEVPRATVKEVAHSVSRTAQ